MIETLYGKLFEVNATSCSVIIECAGVGYHVSVTANTLSHLPTPKHTPDGSPIEGENVRIFTHLSVRDDGVELYGFYSREELSMFKLLISVSGVGPKAAMSVLSLMTPRSLAEAVYAEDAKAVSRAPGVGAKTAARIILELKDKIKKNFPAFTESGGGASGTESANPKLMGANANADVLSDARDALTVLGYSRSEIASAMKNIDLTLPLEEIIKKALAVLMK